MLCDLCNSWLGVYEANKRRTSQKGRRLYREWAAKFFTKIEEHLRKDTGVVYVSRYGERRPRIRKKRKKPVVAMNQNDPEAEAVRKRWWRGVQASIRKAEKRAAKKQSP